MQQNSSNGITMLYPAALDTGVLRAGTPMEPFAAEAVDFLDSLSKELMKHPRTRMLPDVATFAFFCRRGNITNLAKTYSGAETRLGRGVVFHIAPSNVPVNFAYSLVCGILGGNVNIVRVPSKDFEQVSIIAGAIASVLESDSATPFRTRIALVKYDRDSDATSLFSSICDVRVIWGGDATIANIRQSVIPARAFDVTFADRYSFCAIEASRYLADADPAKVAEAFYNDTYLFDQNACSAPHLVVWRGGKDVVERAKKVFWDALHSHTASKYELADVLAVDKLTHFYSQSIGMDIRREETPDNLIWRVEAERLPDSIETFRCKAGYFTEFRVDDLSQVAHIVNRKYQTLAYFGFDSNELSDFVVAGRLCGIDRAVPIGKTTDFSLTWDGYNLIYSLSRVITII